MFLSNFSEKLAKIAFFEKATCVYFNIKSCLCLCLKLTDTQG